MKIERDERRFDFHDIGLAIKRAREASGMTQEQLAYIVDRAPQNPLNFGTNCPKVPALCACCLRPVATAPGPCGNQERVLFQLFLYIFS